MKDITRFYDAQERDYEQALSELKAGRKRSHWIWYIFPQVQGLGFSSISKHYAIEDLKEARAYLADPVLGPRLLECCDALLGLSSSNAGAVMGYPDDLKLRSSMTLFALADPAEPAFRAVLDKFFDGKPDNKTLEILGEEW